jgi:HPt (histidine-containing phosphotransfer) domain-containing protein
MALPLPAGQNRRIRPADRGFGDQQNEVLSTEIGEQTSGPASIERPIDLVHLARTTLGDCSLEREVLQLFEQQANLLLQRMQAAPLEALSTLAHTLKSSAQLIGAAQVVRAAEAVEFIDPAVGTDVTHALAALRAATDEACSFIADLLRAH